MVWSKAFRLNPSVYEGLKVKYDVRYFMAWYIVVYKNKDVLDGLRHVDGQGFCKGLELKSDGTTTARVLILVFYRGVNTYKPKHVFLSYSSFKVSYFRMYKNQVWVWSCLRFWRQNSSKSLHFYATNPMIT